MSAKGSKYVYSRAEFMTLKPRGLLSDIFGDVLSEPTGNSKPTTATPAAQNDRAWQLKSAPAKIRGAVSAPVSSSVQKPIESKSLTRSTAADGSQAPPAMGRGFAQAAAARPAAKIASKIFLSVKYIEMIREKFKDDCRVVPKSFPPRFNKLLRSHVRNDPQRSGRNGRGPRDKRRIDLNRRPAAKLKTTENSWSKAKREASGSQNPDEEIQSKANGIFNKITNKTFDKLTSQLVELGINTKTRMVLVLDALFERALDFHQQCPIYAKVCKKLKTIEVSLDKDEQEATNSKDAMLNFGELLIRKCMETFDIVTSEDGVKTQLAGGKGVSLSEEQKQAKSKRLLLGFMVFMGELFVTEIINRDVISRCILKILDLCASGDEYIECACKLMETVGPTLDRLKIDGREDWFYSLQEKEKLPDIKLRLKFTLENLIDLRCNRWRCSTAPGKPRKRMSDRKNSGPQRSRIESDIEVPEDKSADQEDQERKRAEEEERERRKAEEKLVTKIKGGIAEFLAQRDEEGLFLDVEDLRDNAKMYWETVFDAFIDCKASDVDGYVELISKLAKSGKVSAADYDDGLKSCLEVLPDLALDAPNASNRFGMALGYGLAYQFCSHAITDAFEELDDRSSCTVFTEAIVTLAKCGGAEDSIREMCHAQIESMSAVIPDKNVESVAKSLLRKGIALSTYFESAKDDSDRLKKYLGLTEGLLCGRGVFPEDIQDFLCSLQSHLKQVFGDPTAVDNAVQQLTAQAPQFKENILGAMKSSDESLNAEVTAVIDRYLADDDENKSSILADKIRDIQEIGENALTLFCEKVCLKMLVPGETDIGSVLSLGMAVAASDDIQPEDWTHALLNSFGTLLNLPQGQNVVDDSSSAMRMGWAVALGITQSLCDLVIFEEKAFGAMPPQMRVTVFTAALNQLGSQLGTEGLELAKSIQSEMLYGSSDEHEEVKRELTAHPRLKDFLPKMPADSRA